MTFLENVALVSTSQEQSILSAVKFVLANKSSRSEWLTAPKELDLSFISDQWMQLVTGNKNADLRSLLFVSSKKFDVPQLCVSRETDYG